MTRKVVFILGPPAKGGFVANTGQAREVMPGLPADRAGLKPGDQIFRAGGRRVRGPADFVAAQALLKSPATLDVTIRRAQVSLRVNQEYPATENIRRGDTRGRSNE